MKAILLNNGYLEIILENEKEIRYLKSNPLSTKVYREDKTIINPMLFLNYKKEINCKKYPDGIDFEDYEPFTSKNYISICIDDTRLNHLKKQYIPERKIGTSRAHQHICIYAPGEFLPATENTKTNQWAIFSSIE